MRAFRLVFLLPALTLTIVAVLATAATTTEPRQDITIYNHQFVAPNGGMSPPRAVQFSVPEYTPEALKGGIEGIVRVVAEFGIDGDFRVLRIEKGLGYGLDEKALDAIRQWEFSPAYRSGRRVGVVANIDVEFRLPETHDMKEAMLCTSCHGPKAL